MNILSVINGNTPCKFVYNIVDNIVDYDTPYTEIKDEITLKHLNNKYYIENFLNSKKKIKCKLIKNKKLINFWAKNLNVDFENSILFEIKLKKTKCLITSYYTYIIQIIKNDFDIEEFGLLSMNVFQLVQIGSFTTKLLYLSNYNSNF
jgi:hypothetical protein